MVGPRASSVRIWVRPGGGGLFTHQITLPPRRVYAIIVIVFLIDLTFAINQWLQFKQVRAWKGFAKAEFFYIILSLSSKQLLAWINYGGTARFSE